MTINTMLILSIISTIFSVLSFISAIGCIAYVIGLRNSTHHISYVPLGGKKANKEEIEDKVDEIEEDLQEPYNF
jgi:hypothetical protein